jgi:microcystin-dependent protein
MPILNTGQIFSSGDQVTSQKLMDIADLATFRKTDGTAADGSTIKVDESQGFLKVPSGGITSNELATNSVTATKIVDGAVTSAKLNSDAISALMPTGTVLPFAGVNAPTGYLFCDGDAISRTTYSSLFDVIETTYGVGDNSTTFNIPDLRGRVIAGQDDMGGVSADRLTGLSGGVNGDNLGATGGAETHTLTASQLPQHTHTFSGTVSLDGDSAGAPTEIVMDDNGSGTASNVTTANGGNAGDQAHNNVQPTIILNYIIKT